MLKRAIIGPNFSQVVACRAGRMAAEKVSGAAVFVMMAESFVPRGAFFPILKLTRCILDVFLNQS